ncbi:MAG: AmmeMemoRadiSam system protein B [bacterium]
MIVVEIGSRESEDRINTGYKMKTTKVILLIVFLFTITNCNGQEDKFKNIDVRKAAVAGKFYPADKMKLTNAIKYFLEDAVKTEIKNPVAMVVPHAGYIYSGQTAADCYNNVRNNDYDVVVILGTNHTDATFSKISVYPRKGFETPLGIANIDEQLADSLIAMNEQCVPYLNVHTEEHSVEVQIPFVQYLFPDVKILPIVVGQPSLEKCVQLGKDLAKLLKDRKPLLVASSDLSHYPDYNDAYAVDSTTLCAIVEKTPEEVYLILSKQENKYSNLSTCACGEGPIITVMSYANEVKANCRRIINYTNSGENPVGSEDRVVGYGAVLFAKDDECKIPNHSFVHTVNNYAGNLNNEQKLQLLIIARKTLERYFDSETLPSLKNYSKDMNFNRGAFVTLRKNGELRGCIGHMAEDTRVYNTVSLMAIQAAFNDRRFNPLQKDELKEIEIETSALTPFQKINSLDEFELHRDGLLIKKDGKQGVYLPQVAEETGWTKMEFVEHLCLKAGLQTDDWKDAEFFTFRAEVFKESNFE